MKYENVKKSINIIFTAAVLEFAASVPALFLKQYKIEEFGEDPVYVLTIVLCLLLTVVASVLYITGMIKAKKDEKAFGSVLIMICGVFAINVFDIMLKTVDFPIRFESLVTHLTSLLETATTIYICIGFSKVFAAMDNKKMANDGLITIIVYLAVFAFSSLLEIIGAVNIENAHFKSVLTTVLSSVYSLLSVGCSVKYLIFLFRAKKELQPA